MDPEEDEELPALEDPQDPADEAAWQQLLLDRQRRFTARATPTQQQGPMGARAYDQTAAALAAARGYPQQPEAWPGEQEALAKNPRLKMHGYENQLQASAPAPNGAPGAAPAAPQPGAAPTQDDYQVRLAALMDRIERNQQMQEQGVEAAFERTRPSESEKWLGIAAALASPTQHGSFGETMGNVFNALIQHKQGVRKAESTRQSELARLRQAYDIAGINAAARGLKPPTAASRPRLLVNPLTGEPMDPHTGRTLKQPNDKAWSLLRANPTDGSLASFLREFPQYEEEAKAIVDQARQQRGGL